MKMISYKRSSPGQGLLPVSLWFILPLVLAGALLQGCPMDNAGREDSLYHENRGDQLYEKGDMTAALNEYTAAMEMGSKKLKTYNNLGNVYFRRGQYELAEKYYREALAIDPLYLFSLNNLALTLYKQQNYEDARALVLKGLEKTKGSALLYNTLAQIVIKEGKLKEGIDYLLKSVEANPDYDIALNNLGDLYLKNPGLGEDPLPLIMRAIKKNPNNNLFYDALGWYYCQIGIFDEALIALGKAFIQDPENVEIRVHYATVLEWLGKEKEAMEQWKVVMEIPGEKDLINTARRHYWELKGR